jgi:hypothetical protein
MKSLIKRRMRHPRERGAILAFTGMALLTLVGMTVVGVDLGRLAFTATEVQTVAEVAVTAYAHEWVNQGRAGTPGACTASKSDVCGTAALAVIDGNRIDAQTATNTNITSYEFGAYDFATFGPFRAGATPAAGGKDVQAVRANATATVNNFFAALFGGSSSTVNKNAVATLSCAPTEHPIPLAIGDCTFGGFTGPGDCANLPILTQQGVHLDNSCWTDLGDSGGVSTSELVDWIHYSCGLPGGAQSPGVDAGDVIGVNTGTKTPGCGAIQDCWDAGLKTFTVPIIPCADVLSCESGSKNPTVSGFAKIELEARPICKPSEGTCMCNGVPCPSNLNHCMTIHAICDSDPGQGGGGNCKFGLMGVAMVE